MVWPELSVVDCGGPPRFSRVVARFRRAKKARQRAAPSPGPQRPECPSPRRPALVKLRHTYRYSRQQQPCLLVLAARLPKLSPHAARRPAPLTDSFCLDRAHRLWQPHSLPLLCPCTLFHCLPRPRPRLRGLSLSSYRHLAPELRHAAAPGRAPAMHAQRDATLLLQPHAAVVCMCRATVFLSSRG